MFRLRDAVLNMFFFSCFFLFFFLVCLFLFVVVFFQRSLVDYFFNFSDLCVKKEARHEDLSHRPINATINTQLWQLFRQTIPVHFCSWRKEIKGEGEGNKRSKI